MSKKVQVALLAGFIGLNAAAVVLIGGTYLVTGGEAGELPTFPMLMLAGGLCAAQALRAKGWMGDDAR